MNETLSEKIIRLRKDLDELHDLMRGYQTIIAMGYNDYNKAAVQYMRIDENLKQAEYELLEREGNLVTMHT